MINMHARFVCFVLLLDCEEAYDQGILQHVDGFQYPLIKPRSSEAPFKACCYVQNNTGKRKLFSRTLHASICELRDIIIISFFLQVKPITFINLLLLLLFLGLQVGR